MFISNFFYKQIQDSLNNKAHTHDDFVVRMSEEDSRIDIVYLYDESYCISLLIDGETISFTRCPGPITKCVSGEVKASNGVRMLIHSWIDDIENEIKVTPILRELSEHTSEVNERLSEIEEKVYGLGQEKFTSDEIDNLASKLDTLSEEFTSKLEVEIEDKAALRKEINTLTREIEFLKSQLSSLTKGNWAKALIVRATNWRKRHPKTMKALAVLTREMLPEGVKEHIPVEVVDAISGTNE